MKTMLKQTTLAVAVAAGMLASPSLQAAPKDREAVSIQREPGAFGSIELSGPYRVIVRAQGRNALSLTGERKELDQVETYVSGDTLVVRPAKRGGFFFSAGKVRDRVTINITAAMLSSLKTSGSGDVELDQVSGERFSLTLNGPGDMRAAGAVRELQVRSSGSGDLDLHQMRATRASVNMSGPGDVALAGISGELVATVSGSGDLEAERLRLASATIDIHGPGDVRLDGASGHLRAELHGSGDLDATRLSATNVTVRSHGPGGAGLSTVAGTLDAQLHGSGALQATLSGKRLLLKLEGPGDADISGTVDAVSAQLSGSGSLNGRGLMAGRADVVVRGPGTATVNVRARADTRTAMLDKARLVTIDRKGAREVRE